MYYLARLSTISTDHALVTVLVEHWWHETHTFHHFVTEATVTLQDVTILLGLRIDSQVVIRLIMQDVRATCHKLLDIINP